MKIRMPCVECRPGYVDEMLLVDVQNDSLYRLTCPSGHETRVWLQNQKFELLFDSGCLALLDGYFYESVSSIAAALERFLEFYLHIIFLERVVGHEVLAETMKRIFASQSGPFEKTWKQVAKQSERQLGAFLFTYLLETGNPPEAIDDRKIESYNGKPLRSFRNDVIHNGYVPSRAQVIEYGEYIFQFVRAILSELLTHNAKFISQFTFETALKAHQQPPAPPNASQVIPTVLAIRPPSEGPQSFEEGLEWTRNLRHRAYS
jgi:hypothetical protein